MASISAICWKQQVKGGTSMEFYEIPMGFGMALAMNPPAWNAYNALTEEQRQQILQKAHQAKSRKAMHDIINSIPGM